ncbi:MAG: hydroxymethylpyrimidine/phosphomethylpyrimidine kinase [Nevskia sp.]
MQPERPRVLCLSGHDPSGGAGLQADIETLSAHGVHALGLVTALTVQDSRDVARVIAIDPDLLRAQLDCLLADCRPAVVKLGLIGAAAQLPVILDAIRRCAVPVVCDPVLRAGGGSPLVAEDFASALVRQLLPGITVLTPNAAEARRLVPGAASLEACAQALLDTGCSRVLITGGDEPGASVVNIGYRPDAAPRRYEWPRLPETFHGAGCTLASAIAARLALGDDLDAALLQAQVWTQQSLAAAFAVGRGRRIPGRTRP